MLEFCHVVTSFMHHNLARPDAITSRTSDEKSTFQQLWSANVWLKYPSKLFPWGEFPVPTVGNPALQQIHAYQVLSVA